MTRLSSLAAALEKRIVECRRCPRLVSWREAVAREKRRQFKNDVYWGRPVPAFGAIDSKLLIVGLAPAAHGANRTGRMFTGDESGKWLYRALFRAGLSTQEASVHARDGLELLDVRVSAVVHCAPPDNKPSPGERDACMSYLKEEVTLMHRCEVILCLGSFSWDNVFRVLKEKAPDPFTKPKFSHGTVVKVGAYWVVGSYHPSQQNTFTGRLTEAMFDEVFLSVRKCMGA